MSEMPSWLTHALERGEFCHVAARTGRGPHLTPMVFALSDGHVWVTTSRGSVKARAWRRDPRVGGLVRAGEQAVVFTGHVVPYDLLDPGSWERSVRRSRAVTAASIRFTRKNARFFAGYAVDARHVPLAWTPPGRVFVEIVIERAALVDETTVLETWGTWRPSLASRSSFRALKRGVDALAEVPDDVAEALGRAGHGVLALDGRDGAVVVPAAWTADAAATFASVADPVLSLAAAGPAAPAALSVHRPSWWRARKMLGALVQGPGDLYALDGLRSGAASARSHLEPGAAARPGVALVRIRPERVVWWQGLTSGSVVA